MFRYTNKISKPTSLLYNHGTTHAAKSTKASCFQENNQQKKKELVKNRVEKKVPKID